MSSNAARAAYWARKRAAGNARSAREAMGAFDDDDGEGDDSMLPSTSASASRPSTKTTTSTAAKPKQKLQRSLEAFGFKAPAASTAGPVAKKARVANEKEEEAAEDDEDAVMIVEEERYNDDGDIEKQQQNGKASTTAGKAKVARGPDGLPLSRDEALHSRWQRKVASDDLERKRGAEKLLHEQQQQQQQRALPSSSSSPSAKQQQQQLKPTPLEKQVSDLQSRNPGTLLVFEVGYKFLLFGRDAEVAAPVLRLFAYVERGQLRASFPTPSLPRCVRRLVAAGHAVGVVRQTQTAALKKASGDASERSGPFARELAAVYTAATVDAGGADDVGDQGLSGASSSPSSSSSFVAAGQGCGASAFLFVVADEPVEAATAAAAATVEEATEEGGDVAVEGATMTTDAVVSLGLAAFDAASGDARWACLDDGPLRSSLERALLTTAPAEIAVVEPLSAATARAVDAYAASRPGLRVSELRSFSSSSSSPSSSRSSSISSSTTTSSASAAREALTRFFYPRSSSLASKARDAGGEEEMEASDDDEDNGDDDDGGGGENINGNDTNETQGRALLSSLPGAAARALAAGIHRLDSSRLAAPLLALGPARSLRELEPRGTLALPPNALAALEILAPASSAASVAPSKEGGAAKASSASSSSSSRSASSQQGSLLWLVDRARTRAGRRTLRDWLSRPLADAAAASGRHDAVEEIVAASSSGALPLSGLGAFFARAPDLERGLARCLLRTASPAEFVATMRFVEGAAQRLGVSPSSPSKKAKRTSDSSLNTSSSPPPPPQPASSFAPAVKSALLRSLLSDVASEAARAAASAALAPLDTSPAALGGGGGGGGSGSGGSNSFDRVRLLACPSAFPATAAAKRAVAAAEASLDSLLPQLRKEAGVPTLNFVAVHNQGTHLLELPSSSSSSSIKPPPSWVRVSGTKKVDRYLAPCVSAALQQLEVAKEKLTAAAAAEWSAHLESSVAPRYATLRAAARAAASLDALVAFAEAAVAEGWRRPTFVLGTDDPSSPPPPPPPTLRLRGLVHPMLAASARAAGKQAVANDLELGGGGGGGDDEEEGQGREEKKKKKNPHLLVLTGPNAGGKSCIARAAALAVVMAQAGSFVACSESAELTAFDAAFTRMGAADSLLQGRSTFLEEMAEAASIARAATRRSLIVFDELGRGTSTRDGAAIASAVARFAAEKVQCVTLFITHYPEVAQLAEEMPGRVTAGYMDCIERRGVGQGEGEGEEDEGEEESSSPSVSIPHITFLYKLVKGVAKRSFGLNVARLAGLPEKVVSAAARHAADLEAGEGLLVVADEEGEKGTAATATTATTAKRVFEAASAALASGDDGALLAAAEEAKKALE